MPRRIKGFDLWLVKGEELRMENASPTGTCRTGETRRTINQTIRKIYHCPDPHLPLLLNSSNHQSHLSHMSHSSHYSNSGAEHTPNSSIHPLTFRPFGRFLCKLSPTSIKDHSSLTRYSRLPLPSIGLNSMPHIIRFPLQYGKFTSILRYAISSLFFHSLFGY